MDGWMDVTSRRENDCERHVMRQGKGYVGNDI